MELDLQITAHLISYLNVSFDCIFLKLTYMLVGKSSVLSMNARIALLKVYLFIYNISVMYINYFKYCTEQMMISIP